jgi:hypothetical protein
MTKYEDINYSVEDDHRWLSPAMHFGATQSKS